MHWHLAGRADKTTWFWAFNHFPALYFEREMLVREITRLAKDLAWPRCSAATIKRDVACFVRTYVAQPMSRRASYEDSLESPLTELGLIKSTGPRGGFRFVRGSTSSPWSWGFLLCGDRFLVWFIQLGRTPYRLRPWRTSLALQAESSYWMKTVSLTCLVKWSNSREAPTCGQRRLA